MLLLWPVALVVLSFQVVGHFLLQKLLDEPFHAQTDDRCRDVSFSIQVVARQLIELFAHLLIWWYPLHGVSVSFLPFGRSVP
jgi:hypothetical protein